MPDIENVLKGLECCRRGFCFACPYNDGIDGNVDCKQTWADDAIAILKEQEPAKRNSRRSVNGFSLVWTCGNCGADLQPNNKMARFCSNCGRKVAWE